jgi:DNA-binding MurR/RpiR family transcriptional regulator
MKATQLILEQFPSLSPKLQAAARFIVDHPNEVVISSMRTMAERAQSQPATFVRLAHQLGYAGWPELKAAFAVDMGLHAAGYGDRAKSLARRGSQGDLLGEMFEVLRRNLDETVSHSAVMLPKVVNMLGKAAVVHIAGFRASAPIAYSLFYGYRLFRHSVALLDGQHGGLELQTRAIGKGDAVVIVSFAPYSREAIAVAAAAKAAGAKVVAFTDSSASPLALESDLELLFSVESPSFFPSVAAGVGLAEALLELLMVAGGDSVVKEIDRTEESLFDTGAYLRQPSRRGKTRA